MSGQSTSSIIPPWATSLLGGGRKESAPPAQQLPASHNITGSGSSQPTNHETSIETSLDMGASISISSDPVSEPLNIERHVDDESADESQQPSRSMSPEPVRIASDLPPGTTQPDTRAQSQPTRKKRKKKRKPPKSMHSASLRMEELQRTWEQENDTQSTAPESSGHNAANVRDAGGPPSGKDAITARHHERADQGLPSSPRSGASLPTNGSGEAAFQSEILPSRKRPLLDTTSHSPGPKRHQSKVLDGDENSRQVSRFSRNLGNAAPNGMTGKGELPTQVPAGSNSRPIIIKIKRAKPPPPSSEEESVDEGDVQSASDDEEGEGNGVMDETTQLDRSALDAGLQARIGLDQDVKPEDNLMKTAAGRLYTEWPLPNGTTQHHNGGLCPTKYELWSDPIYPYICPVRDCRSLSTTVPTISAHMTGKHWGGMYNDNGDGTISFLKFYRNRDGSSPPIIVTRNPLQPDALPPAAAFVNERTKKRTEEQLQKSNLKSSGATGSVTAVRRETTRVIPSKPKPESVVSNASRGLAAANTLGRDADLITEDWPKNDELYTYLIELLPPGTPIRNKHYVAEYIQFQKRRNLPEWWTVTRKTAEVPSTVACILLYLTGNVAAQSCSVCAVMPDSLCIIPPGNASAALIQDSKGCGGCWAKSNVWHVRNACSFLTKKGGRVEDESTPEDREGGSASRHIESDPEAEVEVAHPGVVTNKSHKFSTDMLEMEDWEVAPGRIRDDSGPKPENIAFSNSYLTTNQTIPISPDVSFNVVVLKPGGSTQWAAAGSQLRVCSVATGKVRVKMDGAEFILGPNGMFKIRSGATCSASNRLYIDAVLHISTIAEF